VYKGTKCCGRVCIYHSQYFVQFCFCFSDKWKWEVPPYVPRFFDGWQPPAFWLEEIGVPTGSTPNSWPQSGQYKKDGVSSYHAIYYFEIAIIFFADHNFPVNPLLLSISFDVFSNPSCRCT
jgi:hypothetical protein